MAITKLLVMSALLFGTSLLYAQEGPPLLPGLSPDYLNCLDEKDRAMIRMDMLSKDRETLEWNIAHLVQTLNRKQTEIDSLLEKTKRLEEKLAKGMNK